MKNYTIEWNEDSYGRAGFSAENLEEALKILAQVREGDLDPDDVFDWQKTNESGTTFTNLKEVGE